MPQISQVCFVCQNIKNPTVCSVTAYPVILLVRRVEELVLHVAITMGLSKHSVLQAESPRTLPPQSV